MSVDTGFELALRFPVSCLPLMGLFDCASAVRLLSPESTILIRNAEGGTVYRLQLKQATAVMHVINMLAINAGGLHREAHET